jgi:hypothetical protein
MFNTITEISNKYNMNFSDYNEKYHNDILRIFNSINPLELVLDLNSSEILSILGFYYSVNEKYELMKRCYLKCIEKKYVPAMYFLGMHYKNIEKNNEEMVYYLNLAAQDEHLLSLIELANYYRDVVKDYLIMIIIYYTLKNIIKKYNLHDINPKYFLDLDKFINSEIERYKNLV